MTIFALLERKDLMNYRRGQYVLGRTDTLKEQELIMKYLRPCKEFETQFQTVTAISDYLNRHTSLGIDPRKISRELKKLGFIKSRRRLNGCESALNGFYVEKIYSDPDDIQGKLRSDS